MHDALAERPPLMWAAVFHGEEFVMHRAEDCDPALRRDHAARATARNVGDAADVDPVHDHYSAAGAKSITAMGLNSCLCLRDTRSSQGSTCANFCEKTK